MTFGVAPERAAADPDAVIACARSWTGTPYHHQASAKAAGCDCLGLLRGVWRDMIGPEPLPVPPYSRDWGEAGRRETLVLAARAALIEIDLAAAGPGAVLLFRMAPRAIVKHCGILTAPDRFIHARQPTGVMEEPLTRAWRRRAALAFVFPTARAGGVPSRRSIGSPAGRPSEGWP